MEIIQQIGSYAGLAAIVGLAVLSALYFSQARDVRRMRESSGEAEPPPLPPGLTQAQRRTGKPPAAAAGSRPATSAGAALAGAGQPGQGPTAGAAATSPRQQTRVAEPTPTNSGAGPPRPAPSADAGARRGPTAGQVPAAIVARTGPAASGRTLGGAGRKGPGTGQLAPPPSTSGARPWYRRLVARYVVLIVAGVLVLGAAIAYGVTELTGQQAPRPAPPPAGGQADRSEGAPIDPSNVTVAVLNGTSVPGLAAQVADSVEAAGFQRGTVANATEQASAESAVLYAPNAQAAAREVGQELDISQIEPLNGQGGQAVSADADVVVLVGNDQAE